MIAQRGVPVRLYEMRPARSTAVHRTPDFAELVCSNSLKSLELATPHGLLKEEMTALGSKILECALRHRVPAGGALAVDRDRVRGSGHRGSRVAPRHRDRARRDRRDPRARHRRPGGRPARVGAPSGCDRAVHRPGLPPLLRCDRAGDRSRFDRPRRRLRRLALRKGRRRGLPQLPDDAERVRGVRRMRSSPARRRRSTNSTRRRSSKDACRSKRWRGAESTR